MSFSARESVDHSPNRTSVSTLNAFNGSKRNSVTPNIIHNRYSNNNIHDVGNSINATKINYSGINSQNQT